MELRLVKQIQGGPFSSIESAFQANGGTIPDEYSILPYRDDKANQSQLEYLVISKIPLITGKDLKTARQSADSSDSPAVSFFLTPETAQLFSIATEQHIGERLAIVFDNVASSAPVIQDRIGSEGIIHGRFTMQQANDLALLLRSGVLPAPLRILDEGDIKKPSPKAQAETI